MALSPWLRRAAARSGFTWAGMILNYGNHEAPKALLWSCKDVAFKLQRLLSSRLGAPKTSFLWFRWTWEATWAPWELKRTSKRGPQRQFSSSERVFIAQMARLGGAEDAGASSVTVFCEASFTAARVLRGMGSSRWPRPWFDAIVKRRGGSRFSASEATKCCDLRYFDVLPIFVIFWVP